MRLLKWMIKEEWRIHTEIFGGWRFGIFPVIIFAISALSFIFLLSSFTFGALEVGLHYAVFLFGLNVGSVAFVSSDAVENLLGESSFLIFSSRTLPVSERRVLSAFLVKDFLYYAVFYLIPIVLALVPAIYVAEISFSSLSNLPLLWATTTGGFMLGVSLSFLAAALYLRSKILLLIVSAGFGLSIAYLRYGILDFTPLAFFEAPSIRNFVLGFVAIPVLSVAGLLIFKPSSSSRSRKFSERFSSVKSAVTSFGVEKPDLVSKMLLDINRSSGDVWKIFFSMGLLFGVFAFMVGYIDFVKTVVASPGISFAVLLGLSSVSVYTWLNRFDRLENYLVLPVDVEDVLRAKFLAYLFISLPVSYIYLGLASAWFGVGQIAIGILILPLISLYVFGITVYLTGLEPNEFLLDGATFSAYTGAIGIVVIPLFVSSIAYSSENIDPLYITVFVFVLSIIAGGIGYFLYRRAGPKWVGRYAEE